MIPEWAIVGIPLEHITAALLSYGPAIFLAGLGIYFFIAGRKEIDKRSKPTPPIAPKKSELDWNFERDGQPFIGISAGSEQQLKIHNFQPRGWNRTGNPISHIDGYVRSDRTNKKYPIRVNDGHGNMIGPDLIDAIPANCIIDLAAAFSDDDKPITLRKFLDEMVPFTFFFQFDGKEIRHTFALDQIEPRLRSYEQQIRKSMTTPPRVMLKDISDKRIEKERKELIKEARSFVVTTCAKEGKNTDFRAAAEAFAPYFTLRPYLSETFRKKIDASRTIYVNADDSNLPALAAWFLDELDRLEKEWGLR
jgi:hypothetical protein